MRLTSEEHPEAIKRYRHVKPARGWRVNPCAIKCPGTTRTCTRTKGHRGPHVAHGSFSKLLAVWDASSGARGSGEAVRPASETRTRRDRLTRSPVGLRTRDPTGPLEALRRLVGRMISSGDEILFIILFVVMVKIAIDVLLSLG